MKKLILLRICITGCAVVLAVIHILWPSLSIDSITLALFAAAVLPWLQPIVKSLKLPGGFELELWKEVRAAKGAARRAERKAEIASSSRVVSPMSADQVSSQALSSLLSELARKYESIRREQRSGPVRTRAMDAVMYEMVEVASELPREALEELLRAERSGDRLAAYATLYANPDSALLPELVVSVVRHEDKPFGQYWGLLTIGRNLPLSPKEKISDSVVRDLKSFANSVPKGSDRHYEVSRLLARLETEQG